MSQVNKLTTAAKKYQQYGIVCTPTRPNSKGPKLPKWQFATETPFEAFDQHTVAMGIVTGKTSKVWCLDIDSMDNWNRLLTYLSAVGDFDDCVREITPSGGLHYYFKYDDRIKEGTNKGKIIKTGPTGAHTECKTGFDIRNDGGQVICAPSLYSANKKEKEHLNGLPYKWIVDPIDVDGQFTECPEWLVEILTEKTVIHQSADGSIVDIREKQADRKKPSKKAEVQDDEFDVSIDVDDETKETREYQLATLEEIKEGLSHLNPKDFSDYTKWCGLLWSVARGVDEAELDEDAAIDMLDEFSQLADGYEDRESVEKKYNQAQKREGKKSKVTFGSFRMWVASARVAKHSADRVAARAHRTELVNALNSFNHTDQYKWNNFKYDCQSQDFHSLESACEYIAKRINRVLARVTTGNGFFLKKDKAHLVTKVKDIAGKAGCDFTITYTSWKVDKRNTRNPKPPVPEDKETKLSKIIDKVDILADYTTCNYYKDPSTCPEGDFNQWEGVKAKRIEQTEESRQCIKPVLDILHELYADGDEQTYRWLLAYFKEIIVGARRPNGVCLFLYSKLHGAGKNTFIDWFRSYVVGDHASHTFTGLAQACDKHNTLAEGKILMIIDELASAGALCAEFIELIKTNITNKKLLLNPKGLSMYEVTNWCNWIMMSNYMDGINIDANDRRFTCLEVNQKYVGNVEYWTSLYAKLENQAVADAFYTYLLELDTSGYPSPYHPHHTPLRERMQKLKAGSVVAFTDYLTETENIKRVIYEQWEDDKSEDKSDESPPKPQMVWAADELYRTYKQWCIDNLMKVKPRPYYNADLNYGPKNVPLLERTKSSSIYYTIPERDAVVEVKPIFESKKTKARALEKKQAAKPVEESDLGDSVVVEREDNLAY